MVSVLQSATGAERVLILRPQAGDWYIEAMSQPPDTEPRAGLHMPLSSGVSLSMEVFSSAIHSGSAVILSDAARGAKRGADAGLPENRSGSVMCFPIRHDDRVETVLYLENNSAEGAFTENHHALLQAFSGMIAVSLENASLHDALEIELSTREEALEKRLLALTRPLDSAEGIAFEDMFNLADLQLLQDQLARTCGVAALITRPDGTPITQPSNFSDLCGNIIRRTTRGMLNCNHSDSMVGSYNPDGPNIQRCLSAGLCNAGASITVGGRHVANWLIGQVRNETQDDEKILEYAQEIGMDREVFRAAYEKVPVMPQEQFERVAHFLFIVANQLSNVAYQNIQQARFLVERRKAEEEIRRLNQDLERRVVERTTQLEAINRELETFSYSVSHDLRAPLRAINGYAGILREKWARSGDEETRRMCSVISAEAERMGALISGLLQFSRLGRLPATPSSIDMEGMARNVFQEITAPAERERIRFSVDAMPRVSGDATLIRQVWVNLIANAVKYSSRRDVAEIRAGGEEKDGENVYWVADNGTGFDMRYADKLFKVFQRLHSEEEFEGNGIGLAIVQKIVNRHGGRAWASAMADRGATFFFSLPTAAG